MIGFADHLQSLRRVKSVINGVTRYNVYDKEGRLAHVEEGADIATSIQTDYLYAADMTLARIKDGVFTYLHPDHLGSASAGTKEDGTIAFTEFHTPFGEALLNAAANDNQSDFTGHIRDKDIGMSYMQARYMDPHIGRFLSVDPVGFLDTGLPGQFNRYAYTWNDPINANDPDGEIINFVIGAGSSVVLGAVIRGATGGKIFDGKAIAADAALGAVGVGIIGKAAQLGQIAKASRGATASVRRASAARVRGAHGERAAGVGRGGSEGFRNAAGKQRFTDGGAGTSGVIEVKNIATLTRSNIAQIGDEAAFAANTPGKSGAMTLFTRAGTGNIDSARTAASNAGANLTVKTLPNTGANGFRKGLFKGEAAAVGAAAGAGCAAASEEERC